MKPRFPSWSPLALALCGCLLPVLAAQAQHSSEASLHSDSVTAPQPAATPALTAATGDGVDKGITPAPDTPATTETEILADDGATFASKERIAVFSGHVRVTDPRFQLACDKLTVFLNKSASTDVTGAAATPTPASSPPTTAKGSAPAPAPPPANSGGIDHAIAEGHVIIVQQRAATPGAEAKRSVGRADWADFNNKTGDMVLKGNPSVEQNENTHTATSPNTVMTLRRDNSLTTVGPSRTVLPQRKSTDVPGTAAKPGQATPAPKGRRAHVPTSPTAASGVGD